MKLQTSEPPGPESLQSQADLGRQSDLSISHLRVVHERLIGAVISVSAPISAARNIRCRGTRDGGNTGWRYKRYKLDAERHRADTKGMYRGRTGKAGNGLLLFLKLVFSQP